MKKLFIILLTLTSTVAFSQKFQLGIKGGLNVSNYTGGNLKTNALVGFHAGGLVNFMIGNNFSIQPEILFSTQGARYDSAGVNIKVSYINLPVMAKLKFNGGLYIEAGPQFGFKTSEDSKIPDQTVRDFANNLDISIGAGIGYHGKSGLGIGARYMAGISKVGNFNNDASPDYKNSVIQVSVFYTLFNNK